MGHGAMGIGHEKKSYHNAHYFQRTSLIPIAQCPLPHFVILQLISSVIRLISGNRKGSFSVTIYSKGTKQFFAIFLANK
jgi:hypothetical protein